MARGLAALLLSGALAASAAEPAATLRLDLGGGVGLELVLVKAGAFRQGSPAGEQGRAEDEREREVALTRDFYAGKYEVTLHQFARFVQETGYRTEAEKGTSGGFGWDGKALTQSPRFNWRDPGFGVSDEHPVTIVTYDDALAFASWLKRRAGRDVTLPTEAQWEFAARGGTKSRFYAGDAEDAAREIGWWKANAGNGAQPVGRKKPNAYGLHDTAGNVYEWCRDWYGPYTPGPVSDPLETRSTLSDRPRRVLRGGSWLKEARDLRSAARYRNTPGSRNADNGFRVVASAEESSAPPAQPAATARAPAAGAGADSSASSSASLLWIPIAFALVIALVIGIIGFKLFRAMAGGSLQARIKPGPDGFTIFAPRAVAGEKIRYRYVVEGRPETGEMTVSGDPAQGMFVFTGGPPRKVEILNVLAAPGALKPERLKGAVPPPPSVTPRTSRRDDDDDEGPGFRGFPSAY